MDRKAGMERDVLNSIIALLLALADLAERSAGRSYPIRWLVLGRLWQAEAVARDFVAGSASSAARTQWPPASTTVCCGIDPADALRLAASLRALALIVRNLAAQVQRLAFLQFGPTSGGRRKDGPTHGLTSIIRRLGKAAFPPVERCDTS